MAEATPNGALTPEGAAQALSGLRPQDETAQDENQEELEAPEEEESGAEPDEDAEEEEPEESEIELETLARAIGAEPDDLVVRDDGSIGVKTKVDGNEGVVSLSELRKGYQLESSVTRKSMELAESRKAFEAERQAHQAAVEQQAQQVQDYVTLAEHMLTQEYQGIDWKSLQDEDPVAYLTAQQSFQQRQAQIQQMRQGLEYHRQRQHQELQQKTQEYAQAELQTLASKVPQWSDPSVMRTELGEIGKGASQYYGIKPEELSQMMDHRAVLALRDAVEYRKLQAAKNPTMKKVKAAPKIVKPGGGQPNKSTKAQSMDQLRKTHSVHDAAAALGALRGKQNG